MVSPARLALLTLLSLLTPLALAPLGCGEDATHRAGPVSPSVTPGAEASESAEGSSEEPSPASEDVAPEGPGASSAEAPLIAIDTHVDTTQRMLDHDDDIADAVPGGHLDLPRMRRGGLTGAFFSIWVNPRRFEGEAAYQRALALIGAVEKLAHDHPDEAVICRDADEVRAAARSGKAALLMGVEGGHALGTDDEELALSRLHHLYERGVRYMTITWSTDNPLGHSSSGNARSQGLTPLGRRVVAEMNELGMIVDVSHVSDRTFRDIMDVTERPVFASHSSVRSLSNHPRNMTDRMIQRVAAGGGAVCINYYSLFIDIEYRDRRRVLEAENADRFDALAEEHEDYTERGAAEAALALELDPEIRPPDLAVLGAHFDKVVELGGPSAACLGSDFDGISELPTGLRDVGDLGNLRAELERRGLPIAPIFGENVLRILAAQSPE